MMTTSFNTEPEEPIEAPPVQEELDLREIIPALVKRAGKPRPLEDIISDHLCGEKFFDQRRALKRNIQRRIATQDGNSGAELVCRAVLKQLDYHFGVEVTDVPLDIKSAIVGELAVNIARQLIVAAGYILQYPKALGELQAAIDDRDSKDVAQLRTHRILLADRFKQSMVNVARAAVGDEQEITR